MPKPKAYRVIEHEETSTATYKRSVFISTDEDQCIAVMQGLRDWRNALPADDKRRDSLEWEIE